MLGSHLGFLAGFPRAYIYRSLGVDSDSGGFYFWRSARVHSRRARSAYALEIVRRLAGSWRVEMAAGLK